MVSSGMLRRVALVITDVSEKPSASFIRVTRIGELGTTLAATSNRRSVRSVPSAAGRIRQIDKIQLPHWVSSLQPSSL
jgi:hypothetical protein